MSGLNSLSIRTIMGLVIGLMGLMLVASSAGSLVTALDASWSLSKHESDASVSTGWSCSLTDLPFSLEVSI